jgi:hypothetical protein
VQIEIDPASDKNAKKVHLSVPPPLDQTKPGCHGNPTSAAPPTPVRSHGAGSPVTHPGKGGCGPHA